MLFTKQNINKQFATRFVKSHISRVPYLSGSDKKQDEFEIMLYRYINYAGYSRTHVFKSC